MKKTDLKVGMVVKLRCGEFAMVLPMYEGDELCVSGRDIWFPLSRLDDNLLYHDGFPDCNIDEVYGFASPMCAYMLSFSSRECLYVRPHEKKKTWNGKTYEENHRELWNWLADHPDKTKGDWFNKQDVEKRPYCSCFACDYAKKVIGGSCEKCPLCDNGTGGSHCLNGLYHKFKEATGFERAKYAHEIANLPWIDKF